MAEENAELTKMGYTQEHLTLLFQALAAAPDRIQPLTNARLGERKAHKWPAPEHGVSENASWLCRWSSECRGGTKPVLCWLAGP